jgi:hypothetical protein
VCSRVGAGAAWFGRHACRSLDSAAAGQVSLLESYRSAITRLPRDLSDYFLRLAQEHSRCGRPQPPITPF